jgi:SpoVK/Ycf46/Vps4 family AAA+-type ATPase
MPFDGSSGHSPNVAPRTADKKYQAPAKLLRNRANVSRERVSMNVADCITEDLSLPDERFAETWGSIIVEPEIKERILRGALLALELRARLSVDVTALHGLILLYGSPGTGKTTLARGLAQEIAPLVGGKTRLIEVNPHGLMSAEHGQSQQKVMELLSEHVPSLAADTKPTVVLLDEVESIVVARSATSLSANPADVHRATDAVLTALDHVSRQHPHIIFVATSNFTEGLDEAFVSRADVAVELPLPEAKGITAILRRTLLDFGVVYPALAELAEAPGLETVARRLKGADGRRVRKIVTEALGRRQETVLEPNRLTLRDLTEAAIASPIEEVHDAAA